MLYAKITCGNCGHKFEIYSREINHREDIVRCPHCLRQMDPGQWNDLISVFLMAADWNAQSIKANQEHGNPLFYAEFCSKHVPREKILANLELEV